MDAFRLGASVFAFAALGALFNVSSAQAAVKVLLSVGEEGVASGVFGDDRSFRERLCGGYLLPLAREAALRNLGTEISAADCLDENSPELAALVAKGREEGYAFHLGLLRQKSGNYTLTIHHWSRPQNDFPTYARWSFGSQVGIVRTPDESQKIGIERTITRFFRSPLEEQQIIEGVLAAGAKISGSILVTDDHKYIDRKTGRELNWGEAWNTFRAEDPKQRHFALAALEFGAYLSYGAARYYKNGGAASEDAWTTSYFAGVGSKFSSLRLWRFDNDNIGLNFGHTFAGVFPYLIGRSAGYGPFRSFLFSLGQTLAWEIFVEAREVSCIWDNFATGWAGAIVGEDMVKISTVWSRVQHPNAFTKFVSAFFDPVGFLNRRITGDKLPAAGSYDKNGFPDDVWHQFDAYARLGDKPGTVTFGTDQQVVDLVDYQKPCIQETGKACMVESRWVKGTPYARFLIEQSFGPDNTQYFKLFTQTALAAYYSQKLARDAQGRPVGYSFYISPTSAFEFNNERGILKNTSYWADVHIIGARIEINMFFRGNHLKVEMDIFADLAQIRSLAYSKFAAVNDVEGVGTALSYWQNYYGLGYTHRSAVEFTRGRLTLGAFNQTTKLGSVDGLDQDQERITRVFHMSDSRMDSRAWVGLRVFRSIEIQGGVRYREFKGDVVGFGNAHREVVPSLGVHLRF